jgi:hypothetical protein
MYGRWSALPWGVNLEDLDLLGMASGMTLVSVYE